MKKSFLAKKHKENRTGTKESTGLSKSKKK